MNVFDVDHQNNQSVNGENKTLICDEKNLVKVGN